MVNNCNKMPDFVVWEWKLSIIYAPKRVVWGTMSGNLIIFKEKLHGFIVVNIN